MTFLATCYRDLIPQRIRTPLWNARKVIELGVRAIWTPLSEDEEAMRRKASADLRVSLGRPVAKVKIEGVCLNVDLRDQGIGRPLFMNQLYEPRETAYLKECLKPGMVVIDIGANIGYHSAIAGRCVGPTGRVIAVEPEPHNYRLLKRNIAENYLDNIQAENVALGDAERVASLYCSATNFGDHRLEVSASTDHLKTTQIQVTTLDQLVEKHAIRAIDLIKIDVQGYEHHVARGMIRTLNKYDRITILTEFWPYGIASAGGDAEQFFGLFAKRGFEARILTATGVSQPVQYDEVIALLPLFNPEHPDRAYFNLLFEKSKGDLTRSSVNMSL